MTTDASPPRPLTMLRREPDVRQIGSTSFRDTQPRVLPPDRPPLSPVLRRFAEAAEKGQGVSTDAARARRRLA